MASSEGDSVVVDKSDVRIDPFRFGDCPMRLQRHALISSRNISHQLSELSDI